MLAVVVVLAVVLAVVVVFAVVSGTLELTQGVPPKIINWLVI